MKKIILLNFLIICLLACKSNNKTDEKSSGKINAGEKKYEIESGIISYKMDMMGSETKLTVYFKEYGKTEASITKTDIDGEKVTINTLQKDNFYYTYSPEKKTGTKYKMEGEEVLDEAGMKKINESDILKLGGKKVGTESILGKECNVYEIKDSEMESKIWIWKNMFLKNITTQGGMEMVMEAIDLKETTSFPANIFEVPKNIIFSDPSKEIQPEQDFENKDAKG